jgi:chaperonin GroES
MAELIDRRTSSGLSPERELEQLEEIERAKPMGRSILVQRIPEKQGLIVLADTEKEKSVHCEVITVPVNVKQVKKGDRVLIRRYSGSEIELGGQQFTILDIADVLLKL